MDRPPLSFSMPSFPRVHHHNLTNHQPRHSLRMGSIASKLDPCHQSSDVLAGASSVAVKEKETNLKSKSGRRSSVDGSKRIR